MINKLMQMEERIVLDGSVAAAVANAGSGAAGADGAEASAADSAEVSADPVGADEGQNAADSGADNSGGGLQNDDGDDSADDLGLDAALAALDAAGFDSAAHDSLKAIIINTDIAEANDLIDAVGEGIIVVTYNGDTDNLQDVVAQLEALSGGREYDSIAIAAHGSGGGELTLTITEQVTAASLESDAEQIAFFSGLGELLSEDGRIDLLSCNTGDSAAGDELLAAISEVSGAEVAASIDNTGNEDIGGDWLLEKGNVDAAHEYFDSDELAEYDGMLTHFDPSLSYVSGVYSGEDGHLLIDFGFSVEFIGEHWQRVEIWLNEGNPDMPLVALSADELSAFFEQNNSMIDIDLSSQVIPFDFIEGVQYKLIVPCSMYAQASSPFEPNDYAEFIFSVVTGEVVINPVEYHIPVSPPESPAIPDGDSGDSADPLGDLVGDLIDGIESGGAGGVLDGLGGDGEGGNGEPGDNGEGGNGNGEGGSGGGGASDGGNGGGVIANVGSRTEMMVANPFATLITSQEVQVLFDNTIEAFAGLGLDNPAIFSMIQDAMGDTMTTASLVASCEECLANANLLLAEVTEIYGEDLSLSGSGATAETETVAAVVQEAIDNMVQARGNALIANDLLRILALNIGDATERIAENSFSSGITRLAECNEELAYSYEVLNGICMIVQEHKDLGKPLSVAQLNRMIPDILNSAKIVAGGIGDSGDRASKDVLAFLTRQLQNKGVDRDRLDAQVAEVFKQWHVSLGMSKPVSVPQGVDADVAGSEYVPAEAM